MSALYPVLHCPDLAAKQAAVRALYAMGFRRSGRADVEEGLARVNIYPIMDHLIALPQPMGISFGDRLCRDRRDLTLVNSLPHMLSYIRRMGIKP